MTRRSAAALHWSCRHTLQRSSRTGICKHLSGDEVFGSDVLDVDMAGHQVLDGLDVWVGDQLTIHRVNAAGLQPMGGEWRASPWASSTERAGSRLEAGGSRDPGAPPNGSRSEGHRS